MLIIYSRENLSASVEGYSETAESLSQDSCSSRVLQGLFSMVCSAGSEQDVGGRGSPEVSGRSGSPAQMSRD